MDEITTSTCGWSDRRMRQALNVLSPGFPADYPDVKPSGPPKNPVRPIPTDVPVPEPFDVPVPDPKDVPPPDPRDIPPPEPQQPEFNPKPKPRPVP
jgi:hypothetical protein